MNQILEITVLLSLLIIGFVQAGTPNKAYEAKYIKQAEECASENGVDLAEVTAKALSSEAKNPKKVACAKNCIIAKMGYIDEGGNFKEGAFLADFTDITPDQATFFKDCTNSNAKKVLEDCGNYIEVEKCIMERFIKSG